MSRPPGPKDETQEIPRYAPEERRKPSRSTAVPPRPARIGAVRRVTSRRIRRRARRFSAMPAMIVVAILAAAVIGAAVYVAWSREARLPAMTIRH